MAPAGIGDPARDEDTDALFACAEQGGALCTVVGIDGSWSRRLGAQLAVLADGTVCGSLADGCLEQGLAAEANRGGPARTLRLGRGSPHLDIRLPCGSGVDVVVDPAPDRAALLAAVERLRSRQSAEIAVLLHEGGGFIRRYIPPLRLVVLGSGPETEALSRLAAASGIACELARPVGEPGGNLALGRPPEIALDPWTAVAVLFHDHEWERAILPWALAGSAFYVGAQGGASTREQRRAALIGGGTDEGALSRLVSPIGAIGGARSPTPLALSILTDIVFRFEALRPAQGAAAIERVAFALLAGGRSERFGAEDKLRQAFAGTSLGRYTASHGAGMPFGWRFVVTPADGAGLYAGLGYTALTVAAQGEMADSLRVAVSAAAEAGADALLVALADMPFADVSHLQRIVDEFAGVDGPPLYSRATGGVLQPPALIPKRWFPVLLNQHGDQGARALRAGAAAVGCPKRTLIDIDTPEQLAAARAVLASPPGSG